MVKNKDIISLNSKREHCDVRTPCRTPTRDSLPSADILALATGVADKNHTRCAQSHREDATF